MLSRWLDDVVVAEQWPIVTASEMAKAAAKAEDEPSKPPPAVAVAKRVTPDVLMAASQGACPARPPSRAEPLPTST